LAGFGGARLSVADGFGREILNVDSKPIVRAKRCLEPKDVMLGKQHGMHKHRGHNHPADPSPSLHVRQKSKCPESALLCVSNIATRFDSHAAYWLHLRLYLQHTLMGARPS
jgi:hypothetical protein